MSKCEFGVKEIEFLGMNYTADGVQPIRRKVEEFLETMKMSKTVRQIQRLAGFCQFYKYYIPHLAHKLLAFYQLILKTRSSKYRTSTNWHSTVSKKRSANVSR